MMKCVIASCTQFCQDGRLAPDDLLLSQALLARGIDTRIVPWEAEDFPWGEVHIVKIGSAWNYYQSWQRYQQWLHRVARSTLLFNSLEAVLWNLEKGAYFRDLGRRGLPLIPTALLRKGQEVDLAARLNERGWSSAVLKPSVAANSAGCLRVCVGELGSLAAGQAHLDAYLQQQDMLLQPFLRSVKEGGETSHVFVNGTWSHAFGKVAFGPRTADTPIPSGERAVLPPAAEIALAERVFATVQDLLGQRLLYGRVDLVHGEEGQALIMEVELNEPMLHLEQAGTLDRVTQTIIEAGLPARVLIAR